MTSRIPIVFGLAFALATFTFAEPVQAGATSPIMFKVKAGKHNAKGRGKGVKCVSTKKDRTLKFKVRFQDSCRYFNQNPTNQFDWNKVMGISSTRIHTNSIRLGWRYSTTDDRMQLGFYGYIRGQRIAVPITKVKLGEFATVEIRYHKNGLRVTVNGITHEENRSLGLGWFSPSVMMKTCYFGGDETAPKNMNIDVKDISIRNG